MDSEAACQLLSFLLLAYVSKTTGSRDQDLPGWLTLCGWPVQRLFKGAGSALCFF